MFCTFWNILGDINESTVKLRTSTAENSKNKTKQKKIPVGKKFCKSDI